MNKFIKLVLFFAIIFIGNQTFALDYNVYKLDNGQTVVIKQVKNNPIVIIDTWVKTGSINENDKNNGVSHFLEHLFFKGTEKHPTGEFDRILESKGAQTNAATSKDFTHYYVEIPSKDFDLAMNLHADMLLNPQILRKELEKERKVVLEEIGKDANNPQIMLYENMVKMLYTTHPYRRKVLGTSEIIGKITREEILDYYNKHYAPQNMITIVIGDVEPEHVLQTIKNEFKISPRKLEYNVSKPEKPLTKQVSKIDYQAVKSGYMLIGFRGASVQNNDTYALDVLATILGDGRSSVLYQAIKEQKQLAYSIDASNATYKEDGIFEISANFVPTNKDKVQSAIFDEIEKIQKQGVTKEQLNLAKNIIKRDTYYSRESISNISTQIGYTTVLSDDATYYDKYLDNISKVSQADVKRVALKYLGENKAAISVLLPEAFQKSIEKQPAQKLHTAKLVKEQGNIQKYSVDNGLNLIINKNNLNDIVAISIYAKGGCLTEKIKGTAKMVASLMLKGTQNYSSLDLAKQLEDNGIRISPSTSSDNFIVEVLTVKNQLSKTLELLDEVINRASFSDSEIEKTKTSMLNSIKQSRDLPLNVALDEYKTEIFKGSPYAASSKIYEKNLPMIRREDLLEYYKGAFSSQNLTVSVNGDVTLNDILPKIPQIFDNKTSPNLNYSDYSTKILPIKQEKIVKKVNDLETAWIVMGWQTAGVLDEKDSATLHVIDSLLGTGMSSRLFKNIRDNEGLAYQIGSGYSPKVLKGMFTLYIGTSPKNVTLAQEMMKFEVNRLKYEFVNEKELQDAKDKILGKYLLSQETNLDKASLLGWLETSGRGFEFKDKYIELVNSVTASDVLGVANKYFNEDYVISIIEK